MKVAALDLGSNTSLVLIADVEQGRVLRTLHDETTVTRMGQGVHANRKLHPEALARLDECLGRYAAVIRAHAVEKVVAVATSAARDVSNGEALRELGRKHGIPIKIISGDLEAALTFKGALCDRASTDGIAVIDVGGGSTEVITERSGAPKGTSVDVGSVRLTELLITAQPVRASEQRALREYARSAFSRAPLPTGPFKEVVAVAGTATTLAALDQRREFTEHLVHGYTLPLNVIEEWTSRLAAMPLAEREQLPGMQPKRADVIVTGGIILAEAIRALGQTQVTVSTRGVRYGAALEWERLLAL